MNVQQMLIKGFETSNDNLIKKACFQLFEIIKEHIDQLMIKHNYKPKVEWDKIDKHLDFLMELDRGLNREYCYFHQILYGMCYYRGKFLSKKIMLEIFQEAEEFIKKIEELIEYQESLKPKQTSRHNYQSMIKKRNVDYKESIISHFVIKKIKKLYKDRKNGDKRLYRPLFVRL